MPAQKNICMLKSEYNYRGFKIRTTILQELLGFCLWIVLMTTIVTQAIADSGDNNKAGISTNDNYSLTRVNPFYLDKNGLPDTTDLAPGRTLFYQNNFPEFQQSVNNVKGNTIDFPFLPYTIFQPSEVPNELGNNDLTGGIEVGVKFRLAQNGTIHGIRFYRGTGTATAYTVNLWSSSGTLLAGKSATTNSTSEWKEVLFDEPVAIDANITYIASCFNTLDDYVATGTYFGQPKINAALTALEQLVDESNGVYKYTNTTTFPTESGNSSNYWVDVVFDQAPVGGTIEGTTNKNGILLYFFASIQ